MRLFSLSDPCPSGSQGRRRTLRAAVEHAGVRECRRSEKQNKDELTSSTEQARHCKSTYSWFRNLAPYMSSLSTFFMFTPLEKARSRLKNLKLIVRSIKFIDTLSRWIKQSSKKGFYHCVTFFSILILWSKCPAFISLALMAWFWRQASISSQPSNQFCNVREISPISDWNKPNRIRSDFNILIS